MRKPPVPDRGVLHELARLRLHQRDHALDERARREVLPRAALLLLGVLLEQPLVEVAEPLGLGAVPVERVDRLDDGAQVPRLPERRRRVRVDRLHAPRALAAEVEEELLVERRAARRRPSSRGRPSGSPSGSASSVPVSFAILRKSRYVSSVTYWW